MVDNSILKELNSKENYSEYKKEFLNELKLSLYKDKLFGKKIENLECGFIYQFYSPDNKDGIYYILPYKEFKKEN